MKKMFRMLFIAKSRSIFLLVFMLFIISCTPKSSDAPIAVNYKQGYGGLEISVLPNYPPKEILEKGSFSIAVHLQNRGAYDIQRGEVAIIGINQVFNPLEKNEEIMQPLQGKNFNLPEGEFYIEEFNGRNSFIPPGNDEYMAEFFVLAEYEYENILQADICINPALIHIETSEDICLVQQEMRFSGQGGPVGIKTVESIIGSTEGNTNAQFTFTIENRGNGELASPVIIEEVRAGGKLLKCNTKELDKNTVKEGKAKFVCDFSEPIKSPYTTPLSAVLSYKYRINEEGNFLIVRLG